VDKLKNIITKTPKNLKNYNLYHNAEGLFSDAAQCLNDLT